MSEASVKSRVEVPFSSAAGGVGWGGGSVIVKPVSVLVSHSCPSITAETSARLLEAVLGIETGHMP